MSNLNTIDNQADSTSGSVLSRISIVTWLTLVLSIVSLAFSLYNLHYAQQQAERSFEQYSVNQPVQDNGNFYYVPGDESISLNAPTAEHPYGGYEGHQIEITVPDSGTIWSALETRVTQDLLQSQPAVITPEGVLASTASNPVWKSQLVANLANELVRQTGIAPESVQPGTKLVLDLTTEPTGFSTSTSQLSDDSAQEPSNNIPVAPNVPSADERSNESHDSSSDNFQETAQG